MKSKECYKRPNLEQNYQLKLNWKTRKLHLLMQHLLTTHRIVLVLNQLPLSIPTTVHQITPSQNQLNNNKVYSLIAN